MGGSEGEDDSQSRAGYPVGLSHSVRGSAWNVGFGQDMGCQSQH